MAGSLNKVMLIGNLGKDPEIRTTQSGDKIVNLTLATGESWTDKQTGERKEKTEWTRIVIFNERLADVAEKYLRKGSKLYAEGQLQTRKWTDQQGVERYQTEVVLSRFKGELTLLDSRSADTAQSPLPRGLSREQTTNPRYKPIEAGAGSDLDDTIPF